MRRRLNGWILGAFWGAAALTLLWLLHPRPSAQFDDGAVVIRYMAPEGPVGDAMEDALREFEFLSRRRHEATGGASPVYRVVAGQHASRNQVEDPTRFLLSLVGGEPPDVILFDRFAISEWAAKGAFSPLAPLVAADRAAWEAWAAAPDTADRLPPWPGATEEPPRAVGAAALPAVHPIRQEDFYPACWDEAVFTDPHTGARTLYGIPFNADDRALFYNKDILVRHGYTNELGDARPPRTWEELEEMAVAMTERNPDGTIQTIGFIPNFGNSWLYLYGWQAGGEFMSPDGRTCTLASPGVLRALEFMKRIYDRLGGVKEVYAFQSTFQGDALDPFILGKVAMKIDGVWIMESLARFGLDLDFALAPPPMPADQLAQGRTPISWVGGWAYAIPATSRHQDGAWELIRFLVSRRAVQIIAASSEHAAQAQGQLYIPRQNPNREHNVWLHQTRIEDNPDLPEKFKAAMRVFNDLLESSRYRPVTPVGQKLWNAQIWAMEDAIFGKKSPRDALLHYSAIVQRDLDAALAPPPGRPIRSWGWFFALYAVLLIGVGALVVRNDLRGSSGRGRLLRFLSGEKAEPAIIEGRKGSYFRAQWKDGVVCALPFLIGFVVFTGGPLLFSIVISFSRFDILSDAVFTGLDNYRFLLTQDELFWKSLGNTLFMVLGVPLGMALGLAMAILLTRKVRGVALWRTFFYLPSIVPVVASSILWIWIFNPQSGLLNQLLASIGLAGPLWLQDEATSKWALLLMGLWTAGGGMIIWIAGLKGISASYYEAASIDGASPWQQFVHITLPMLTPYIFFNLVMGLIATFQVFTQAFIMTSGGPVNSTLFYVYHLFNNAFRYLHMGQACAMAWLLFLLVLALTALQLHLSSRWVHYEEEG